MVRNLIPWKKKQEVARSPSSAAGSPFDLLHDRMDELFDDFFKEFGSLGSSRWFGDEPSGPRFEMSETDNEIQVKAELPGMDEKDIEVIVDDGLLTIRGEKKEESEKKKRNVTLSELHYGQFHRSIPLPDGVDREQVQAKFKRGVLTLTLPLTAPRRSHGRQIPVSSD